MYLNTEIEPISRYFLEYRIESNFYNQYLNNTRYDNNFVKFRWHQNICGKRNYQHEISHSPWVASFGVQINAFVSFNDGVLNILFLRPDEGQHLTNPDQTARNAEFEAADEEIDRFRHVCRHFRTEELANDWNRLVDFRDETQ